MGESIPPLDPITGALLVGTWLNSLLYSIELLQMFSYFRSFPSDDSRIKVLVVVAFALDTTAGLSNYTAVYLYTIRHAGDVAYLRVQIWTFPVLAISTGLVAVLVQSFLTFRFWRFTHNTPLTIVLFLLIGTTLGACFAAGIYTVLFPNYADRHKSMIPVRAWLISQAATDLLIASALLWELHRWSSPNAFDRTRSLLHRLMMHTLTTGGASALVAVACLIAFSIDQENNIALSIAYSLGRVYMLTMLANLNLRKSLNEILAVQDLITIPHAPRAPSQTQTAGIVRQLEEEVDWNDARTKI
ncbi:hypothetical protein MIND_01330900 [Mycena indigotica]|uniref:DUF6534 domain-containing protein n=1 Tax=Mycena indigotica TaxID=2126181 RepID=A0A8H6S0V5_9AGAR|nr:uncharacterized protein MIND_01330900 [Mycena indigotica]KAF7290175.1 hypothetical protein MIND_01330900 [Mycena indigotica]